MAHRPTLSIVPDAGPDDPFADFLRDLAFAPMLTRALVLERDHSEIEAADTQLFRWAESRMAWERAIAKEHGTRITPVRGITKLREAVTSTLLRSDLAASVRGNLAARNIEAAVRESYGVEDAA